ncbi:hypothetical protein HY612_01910 [Candidatus Roizmanbacteria bacterium]|nr:hypothetical protein [Candidatus Roizmanbacteria bacterium]
MNEEKSSQDTVSKNSLTFLSIGILVVFLALVGGVYWWVSKKSKGQVVFPAGINYTGNETPAPTQQPQRPQYDYSKMVSAANWTDFVSPQGQYTFQYPPEMIPLIFPGDANDSVTFDVSDIPSQFNLMVLFETISNYDAKLRGRQEEFVRNYWKFFGGLKDMKDIETFTTEKGLNGWKVRYVTQGDVVGSDNYFFVITGQNDKILHVNNIFPADGQTVFNRLLNSLEFKK